MSLESPSLNLISNDSLDQGAIDGDVIIKNPLEKDGGHVKAEEEAIADDDLDDNDDKASAAFDPLYEMKIILHVALPMVIAFSAQMSMTLVSLGFAGHIGEMELAAVGIGQTFANVTGQASCLGILSAVDTLCSQAFGAGKEHYGTLGIVLQRALLISFVFAIPVSIIWWMTEPILLLAKQDQDISRLAGIHVKWVLPGLVPLYAQECQKRYLQAQSIVWPQVIAGCIALITHISANWVLIKWLDLGFVGLGMAYGISYTTLSLTLTIIMISFSLHKETWPGWSWEAFKGWGEFLKLGVPGAAQLCFEWVGFEINTLLAGLIGITEVSAQAIMMTTLAMAFMLPLGLSIGASTRVGNHLGEGNSVCAKKSAFLTIAVAATCEVIFASVVFIFRHSWANFSGDNPDVIQLVGATIPIMCGFMIFDGIQGVSAGALRGCGKQSVGAISNLVAFYVIGLPVGIALSFYFEVGLKGLWVGMAAGSFVAAIISLSFFSVVNWDKLANEAKTRINEQETFRVDDDIELNEI